MVKCARVAHERRAFASQNFERKAIHFDQFTLSVIRTLGTPRSQVVLGNALGGARTAVRLPRYLEFPSATWERGALLKLVRCRRSLAATLAALPSMSLRPLASIRNSDFEIRNFPRPAL